MQKELARSIIEHQQLILQDHHELRKTQVLTAVKKLHLPTDSIPAVLRFMFPIPADNLADLPEFQAKAIHLVFSSSERGVTNSYTRVGGVLGKDRRTVSRAVRRALDKANRDLGF